MRPALLILAILITCHGRAAEKAVHFLKKTDAWYASAEGRQMADVILSYQAEAGGWPKNIDTVSEPFTGDPKTLKGTFDNSATTDELRFLARSFNATQEKKYRDAFERGLAHILLAQYANGGWPQYFPLSGTYNQHITFNDGAMVRLMNFLREVATEQRYGFVDEKQKGAAREAFAKGVACILKSQIIVDGKPTVWCQQHHEVTLAPAGARTYELPSFCGAESVGMIRLLMSLEKPTAEIKAAIEGSIDWLEAHKITGLRIDDLVDSKSPTGKNIVAVPDPKAPPVWARYYDLKTGLPYFCDRDGKPKATIAEIGYERRNGYGWYGEWPASLLAQDYPKWKQAHR